MDKEKWGRGRIRRMSVFNDLHQRKVGWRLKEVRLTAGQIVVSLSERARSCCTSYCTASTCHMLDMPAF